MLARGATTICPVPVTSLYSHRGLYRLISYLNRQKQSRRTVTGAHRIRLLCALESEGGSPVGSKVSLRRPGGGTFSNYAALYTLAALPICPCHGLSISVLCVM